ncbi:hypothetical protein [Corynebacterium jeikeium]|nr:hypothetical protein [Corynebacterium jeikeium]
MADRNLGITAPLATVAGQNLGITAPPAAGASGEGTAKLRV